MTIRLIGYIKGDEYLFDLPVNGILSYIDGIKDGTISYDRDPYSDYLMFFHIDSKQTFETLKLLLTDNILVFTYDDLANHMIGSPVYNIYNKWKTNIRQQSISSSFAWRLALDKLSELAEVHVNAYLSIVKNVNCISYNPNHESEETAIDRINRIRISNIESEFINSIGRSDLTTYVDENGFIQQKQNIK
jgi:hypothetical protein